MELLLGSETALQQSTFLRKGTQNISLCEALSVCKRQIPGGSEVQVAQNRSGIGVYSKDTGEMSSSERSQQLTCPASPGPEVLQLMASLSPSLCCPQLPSLFCLLPVGWLADCFGNCFNSFSLEHLTIPVQRSCAQPYRALALAAPVVQAPLQGLPATLQRRGHEPRLVHDCLSS